MKKQSVYPRRVFGFDSFVVACEEDCTEKSDKPATMRTVHKYSLAEYLVPLKTELPIITVTILQDFTSTWAEKGMFFRAIMPRAGPIEFVMEGFRYPQTDPVFPVSPREAGIRRRTNPAAKKHPKLCNPWRDFRCGKRAPSGA